ncbi:uncharacterized protein LOC114349395 [Diabrotica virgifera virgifera]|uniref:Uncharacterized protein LOC114349395 n=1 Tax=Diabrotica virgifera virgifera TaxID=50390 RepID=A0A6P7HA63_DIAVI|nr:uncharacterized protein LOC114349395 [Diabrotica virgifera virgifera]
MYRLIFNRFLKAVKVPNDIVRRNISCSSRVFNQEFQNDRPVKFSASPASHYKAQSSRTGVHYESRLWYEPYVIIASISVFLIYFTILREENDIDEELSRSLYSRIEGLEEFQLRESLKYNKEHGKDTTDILKRLAELENEKREKTES